MKTLVVVDYQKDFVDGALGFPDADKLEAGIIKKIQEYLEAGGNVIYTMDTHYENYLKTREGKQLPIPHCIKDTNGWQLYGKVKSVMEAARKEFGNIRVYQINKTTFGVAPQSILDYKKDILQGTTLTDDYMESFEFVGLVTNMCVVSNVAVFQAAYPNAQMIVNPRLVDSFDKNLHNQTIEVLRGMQVQILDVAA